jgi:glycosyltransferase involved in cell wall biosynthesis
MPIFNAERYLAEAIESILCQTYENFELLLLDDGSSDQSAEIAERFAAKDQRVVFVRGDHKGVVYWRNFGCEAARGEFVAMMDADDISAVGRFEAQVCFLDGHPECCLVGSQALRIDSDGLPISVWKVPKHHEAIDANLMRGRGGTMINPSVMIRTEIVRRIGGYRLEWAEDYDLFLRLASVAKLANLPRELLHYRLHSKSLTFAKAELQARAARRALEDAWAQRNQNGTIPFPICEHRLRSDDELSWDWARAALNERHYQTARKYGFALLRKRPREIRRWILFAASCLGPIASMLKGIIPYRLGESKSRS